MKNYLFQTMFGTTVKVYEATIFFTHTETGKCRVCTDWLWAQTLDAAKEFMQRPYNHVQEGCVALETVMVSVKPVNLVAEPNPANIANMAKGLPFHFNRDKPGIFRDKWGY